MAPIAKLVTFKFDGDFQRQGFRVTLEIGTDGDLPDLELSGALPPSPELVQQLHRWQQHYHSLEGATRIKPKAIVYQGSIHLVEACRQAGVELGDRLQQWLTADSFRVLDLRLRESLNRDDSVRIVIRSADPHIPHLPWHLWDLIERYPQAEVTLGAPTLERIAQPCTSPSKPPIVRILAILGDSNGIDVEVDRHLLQALPDAEVTFLVEPLRSLINDHLWDQPWHILFFAGHSHTQAEQGCIAINPHDSLTLAELKYGLRRAIAQGLQLAIFNSCDGMGLAHELEPLRLPQLILMREPVPDRIAQAFLTQFLRAFSQGDSLYLAVRQARERLQGLEREFPCASWLPCLYHISAEPPLDWQALRHNSTLESPGVVRHKDDSQVSSPPVGAFRETPLRDSCLQPATPQSPSQSPSSTTFPQPIARQLPLWMALVTSVVVAAGMMGVRSLGLLQRWELAAFDQLMRSRPTETLPKRLLIIEATESDVNTYGYPLPDEVLSEAIARLQSQKPRVIGLDIFRSQAITSLHQTLQQPNVVSLCSVRRSDNPDRPGISPPPDLPETQLGFSNVVPDPDRVLRRQLMFMQPDPADPCATRFSLNTIVALHYLDQDGIKPQTLDNHQMQLGNARFTPLETKGGVYHGIDRWGFQVLLNYAELEQFADRLSLSQLLNNAPLPNLSDRAVLIGMTAPVTNPTDYFFTPDSGTWAAKPIAGVHIQAQMVNHLLAAALDGRRILNPLPEWGDRAWIALWSAIGAGLAWKIRRNEIILGIALSTAVAMLYGIAWVALIAGWWLPLVPAGLALISSTAPLLLGRRYIAQSTRPNPD
ncbi:CHASE2 domain-containing protein [Oculatella sp. FACHB-28]|uniref:CHASE2 domain-containing protein n=1 Tax=Oculatella sp. FACHB-28 TaxID=2692845 RepID=UPI0016828283|nr:CHASE2 domain-containing protein [Oculatella sp. FACHB-28]MBD2055788.1 CHASE2 domain-containing protein [Oculatella sp. FACHB-28]